MMNTSLYVQAIAALIVVSLHALAAQDARRHTNVVILGATGDLATRYLWKGFFQLYQSSTTNDSFTFYGCARAAPDKGKSSLQNALVKSLICPPGAASCAEVRKKFIQHVIYCQTKSSEHYLHLAQLIQNNMKELYGEDWKLAEKGRLFYLSIPPSVYPSAAENIAIHCKPPSGSLAWLRLVIEKPFGHDLNSAKALTDQLNQFFTEDQIYRVDHYLGKSAVQAILPFRMANADHYEKLWNRNHIDRIEIVMKERIDVKDRIIFFNEVGVIRDVMQNHLTELLVLIAMEMPSDLKDVADIKRKKLDLLHQIRHPSVNSILIGQYASYASEAMSELQDKYNNRAIDLSTPTFASIVLNVDSPRWHGVPFVLMTGKKLDRKSSHVRIVFKKNSFCLNENGAGTACNNAEREVRFQISPGVSGKPEITVSSHLPN